MGSTSGFSNGMEKTLYGAIGALIVLTILFQSGPSFFPNWSSIADIPPVIPVVMPFLVLILFITLVMGTIKRGK